MTIQHNINKGFVKHVIANYKNPALVIFRAIPGITLSTARKIVAFYK